MGYRAQTIRGISWVGALRGATRIIAFAKTLVLARVLTPAQFGVIGIATLVLKLLEILTETGVNIVLVQKKEKIDAYIDTAWVVSILRGIIIASVIALSSGYVATFFNTSDARRLLLLVSIVPLMRGFINPSIVKFQKDLEFQKEFLFRFSIFLFDGIVAIASALFTHDAASIIYGFIAGEILEITLSYVLVSPRPRFNFQLTQIKEIVQKGKWVTGAGLFEYLFREGDDIVVGKLLGAGPLGFYDMAYKIATLPISEVADVVAKVTFPVFVKINHDALRLRRAFVKTLFSIAAIAIPFGILIFSFAHILIPVMLGDVWKPIIPALRAVSVYAVLRALISPSLSLFLATERQRLVTLVTFLGIAVMAVTIFPLVGAYGILGAGYATIVSMGVTLPVVFWLTWSILYKHAKTIPHWGRSD